MRWELAVTNIKIAGHIILIVEDEPLIALELFSAFERAGATVKLSRVLADALELIESGEISAAVLDHSLPDGGTQMLCDELLRRSIPFVHYTGQTKVEGACQTAPLIPKPSKSADIVATVASLLTHRAA